MQVSILETAEKLDKIHNWNMLTLEQKSSNKYIIVKNTF